MVDQLSRDATVATHRPLVITGATGFLGRHLLAHLDSHWKGELLGITRRDASSIPARVNVLRGDMMDASAVTRAIPAGSDVVHLAHDWNAGRDGNLKMAAVVADACLEARVRRLVYVSSAAVAGTCRDRWVTEASACAGVTDYQRAKLAIETFLVKRARGRFSLAILRPTSIFGEGGASLRRLARDLRGRSSLTNYVRSTVVGRRAMHLVPVETVTASIAFLLERPAVFEEQLFIVSEDESPENNYLDVERVLRRAFGLRDYPAPPVSFPTAWLTVILRASRRLEIRPGTRFSGARLRAAGFVAPVGFADALARYAQRLASEPAGK